MSEASNVRILISEEAFNLLVGRCHSNRLLKRLVNKSNYFIEEDEYTLIGWDGIKWGNDYEDIKLFLDVLKELDVKVEKSKVALSNYFYKLIEITSSGETIVTTNDLENKYTSDLYVNHSFSI